MTKAVELLRTVAGRAMPAGTAADAVLEATDGLLRQVISLETFLGAFEGAGLDPRLAAKVAAACAALPGPGAGPAGRPERGGTARIALWTAPEGMDAALATTRTSRLLTEQLYGTLTALDSDGRPYPDLAEWIAVSDDAQTYTFGIRPGARFHDGSEVTAEDVAFSLDRIADPATHYHFSVWTEEMAGTEVVDRHTVRLRLSRPTGPILTWLAFCGAGIVPRGRVTDGWDLDRQPIGSGPFRWVSGAIGDPVIRLERHDRTGRLSPHLDALEFVTLPDPAERAGALLEGRVQLDGLVDPSQWERLEADPAITREAIPDGRWHWLVVNCRDALLADVRVRRAISLALDRRAMLERSYGGRGTTLERTAVADWSWGRSGDDVAQTGRADPKAARALLGVVGIPAGTPIRIDVTAALPVLAGLADVVADGLREVGFRPTVAVHEPAENGEIVRAGGPFQLSLSYWGSPINDPDDFLYNAYRSDGRYEVGGGGSPELDGLLASARASVDQAERTEAYRRVQDVALELLPIIPTIQPPVLRAYRTSLRGLIPMRNGQLRTLREAWLGR